MRGYLPSYSPISGAVSVILKRPLLFLLLALCLAPTWAQNDPLFEAVAASRHETAAWLLLNQGASRGLRNSANGTALDIAQRRGYGEIVKLLQSR